MTYPARSAERFNSHEDVGRDLIVRRTRAAMRDRKGADLSREDIARYAGVTPALISYYFPDRSSLFEAIAGPIIGRYGDDVRQAIDADQALNERLKGLIRVYLAVHYRERHLLDFYIGSARKGGKDFNLALLTQIQAAAVAFVGELLDGNCLLGECPHAVQSTLWGMCKQIALRSEDERPAGPSVDDRIASETELLYDFFMNGVAIVLPTGPMLQVAGLDGATAAASTRSGSWK